MNFSSCLSIVDISRGWLPTVRTEHGHAVDLLFAWIFYIVLGMTLLVLGFLVVAVLRFRDRSNGEREMIRAGVPIRIEVLWTILPALILIALAIASRNVWNTVTSPPQSDADPLRVLVIGQQFKWNFIYAGPDNRLGRYLQFPRPTDATWPAYPVGIDATDLTTSFQGSTGPAMLPYAAATQAINAYIEQINPLGKDFTDPAGIDDDWAPQPGRPLMLPAGRAIDLAVMSKDVIHSFFLPNYRVKMDAVPGRIGHLYFQITEPATRVVLLGEVHPDDPIWLDALTPSAIQSGNPPEFAIPHPTEKVRLGNRQVPAPILRNLESLQSAAEKRLGRRASAGGPDLNPDAIRQEIALMRDELRSQGVEQLTVIGRTDEIVCEELCGAQHYTMRGELHVVSAVEFDRFVMRFQK